MLITGCASDADLCSDTARRLVDHDRRCGVEAMTRDEYEEALGGPGCEGAVVRDRSSLTEACWPALEDDACTATWLLPEACDDQF